MRKDEPSNKAVLNFIGKVLMCLVSLIGAVLMSMGAIFILGNYGYIGNDAKMSIFGMGVLMLFWGMLRIYYQEQQEEK